MVDRVSEFLENSKEIEKLLTELLPLINRQNQILSKIKNEKIK
tara:strand:+ start:1441 stop:1569 length:129 start_codon:yes stop_codon:yes gene_type:complete